MNVFDIIKSINDKNSLEWNEIEKIYNSFIINRGFSFFPDTLMQANIMNQFAFLNKEMQYGFLFNSIKKRKRFSKWFKKESNDDLALIQEVFGYSIEKARMVYQFISKEYLDQLKEEMNSKGGVQK